MSLWQFCAYVCLDGWMCVRVFELGVFARKEWWIKGLWWVWSCDCHGPWWPYLLTDYPGEGEVASFLFYFLLLSLHPSFCQDSLSSHPSWLGWSLYLLWLPVPSQETRTHGPAQKRSFLIIPHSEESSSSWPFLLDSLTWRSRHTHLTCQCRGE